MKDILFLLPEIFLAATFLGIIAGEVGFHGEQTRLTAVNTLIGLGGALVQTILSYQYGTSWVFGHTISVDGLSLFFKLFFILLAILVVASSTQSREIAEEKRSEFCALVVASTLAMSLAASSADLLLAFLALQSLNMLGYFLSAFGKRSTLSTEAAVKYMMFGSLSAGLLLYGIAMLFAYTHSLNMYEMHRKLIEASLPHEIQLVIFIMIFLSLAMQIAAFPMHFWLSDVLEGAPTPVSAFLSIGPRAAGFALATRLLITLFAQPSLEPGLWQTLSGVDWTRIVSVCAGATMLMGSLLAYRQTGAKRLVAYLVMAQSGFFLMGLLVLDQVGIAAVLYNLVVDLFALVGAYSILAFLFDELHSDKLEDYKGVLGRAVPECVALVLFLLCLVGLPPFPGFIGKFALVGAAVRRQWYGLGVVAILSMGFSAIAVARIAFSLVGDFRSVRFESMNIGEGSVALPIRSRRAFLVTLLVPMALVGVFSNAVLNWAGRSLHFIFW